MSGVDAISALAAPPRIFSPAERRWLSWPSLPVLAEATARAILLSLFFVIVYFGADALAARRGFALGIYLEAELAIPLVPVFIVPYLSMFVLYLVPVFQLTIGEIRTLARRILAGEAIAGALFILLPTRLGFVDAPVEGSFAPVFGWVRAHDAAHNLVPSLHVISSSLVALSLARRAMPPLRGVYLVWLALIVASVVLTHRHHLIDIVAALGVLTICIKIIPDDVPPPTSSSMENFQ